MHKTSINSLELMMRASFHENEWGEEEPCENEEFNRYDQTLANEDLAIYGGLGLWLAGLMSNQATYERSDTS